jgi:hypothetical protein
VTSETVSTERYLVVSGGCDSEQYWSRFWRFRSVAGVHTTFATTIVPQCPLLSAERADSVAPPNGMLVPAQTAWAPVRVNLAPFLCSDGSLDECRLEATLRNCVDTGERIHDTRRWPTPDMQHDSWLNRRLAIQVTGFGDVIRKMGLKPDSHGSLRVLYQLLLRIKETLRSRSQEIALDADPLPAISLSDPSLHLPRGNIRDDWQRRWRESVAATQVRHRNLLVLSPWSLFPSGEVADYRYSELLPLLRHADACAFRRTVSIDHWNVNEFKRFHQRAMAVLQQRGTLSRFAKCV